MGEGTNAPYYPVQLQLAGQRCMVIGGGQVAERKIRGLLEVQAQVIAISPFFTPQIEKWIEEAVIEGHRREYVYGDLTADTTLVFAATAKTEVNESIGLDARKLGLLVNVAHASELSNFVNPSTMRRGKLIVAVSTSGASPEVAKRITSELEEQYGDEYEVYLDVLHRLRLMVQERVLDASQRRQLMKRMLHTDWLDQIRRGTTTPWLTEAYLHAWIDEQMVAIEHDSGLRER
ncbi:precorrin-2 dehydrogenase/sirohydrochlorin ferrochelatase family protein [Paenibacillus selenitireducens]|nr:NAD(P)-dependent oxidoreductase [Paenibacillus selenitireducens]